VGRGWNINNLSSQKQKRNKKKGRHLSAIPLKTNQEKKFVKYNKKF
jgi:hypothetical protein